MPAHQDLPVLACPIGPVVDIVFSRWTTPILWSLHEHGRQRFVELQRRIDTITPKVLTQRLRRLERDGLITRTYHPEVPPRRRVRDRRPGPQPRAAVRHAVALGHGQSRPRRAGPGRLRRSARMTAGTSRAGDLR